MSEPARDDEPLLHISTATAWAAADSVGEYHDPSLETEGFIHCSYRHQVLVPATERFAGKHDLVLLVIDPARLTSEVVVEDSYGTGQSFPHIYGSIDIAAVERVVPFPPRPDGGFDLPTDL